MAVAFWTLPVMHERPSWSASLTTVLLSAFSVPSVFFHFSHFCSGTSLWLLILLFSSILVFSGIPFRVLFSSHSHSFKFHPYASKCQICSSTLISLRSLQINISSNLLDLLLWQKGCQNPIHYCGKLHSGHKFFPSLYACPFAGDFAAPLIKRQSQCPHSLHLNLAI